MSELVYLEGLMGAVSLTDLTITYLVRLPQKSSKELSWIHIEYRPQLNLFALEDTAILGTVLGWTYPYQTILPNGPTVHRSILCSPGLWRTKSLYECGPFTIARKWPWNIWPANVKRKNAINLMNETHYMVFSSWNALIWSFGFGVQS